MKKFAILALGAFLLAACANEPIYNVSAHPVPYAAQRLSMAQIEAAIIEAGQGRGWKFTKIGEGKLHAMQYQPKYSADVEIQFDQKSYTILHRSTRGMKEQGNSIHPHYNFWVRNLESDIDARLANAPLMAR